MASVISMASGLQHSEIHPYEFDNIRHQKLKHMQIMTNVW